MLVIGDCLMKLWLGVSFSRVSCEVFSGSKLNRCMWLWNSGCWGIIFRFLRLWILGGMFMFSNGCILWSILFIEVIYC